LTISTYKNEDTSVWLERRFESIGMACNCHPTYEFYCIVELGRNVKPKYDIPANLRNNILVDDSSLDEDY